MLTGVFELQVCRGLGYVTQDMTKTVESKVRIARSAQDTWKLRCNFELEQHIAQLEKAWESAQQELESATCINYTENINSELFEHARPQRVKDSRK